MKKHKFSIIYSIVLLGFTGYMLLNTFVISSAYQTEAGEMNASMFGSDTVASLSADSDEESEQTKEVEEDTDETENSTSEESKTTSKKHGKKPGKSSQNSSDTESLADETKTLTANTTSDGVIDTYTSDGASITITQYTYNGSKVYVADVTLSSAEYLKTAFAERSYGRNITETTSSMAQENGAILAINGDNYGSQESGYVIRNGVIYRDEAGDEDVLCIYADGTMKVIDPDDYTAKELLDSGVWQAFSFGPALIEDGTISVSEDDEVGKAKASNPRTAIGVIDDLHYLFVVSDGRTDDSKGLSLYQLAEFMESLGAETAYNLDGGGSSTMVFGEDVINNPTSTGNSIKEREVNDIVYIG